MITAAMIYALFEQERPSIVAENPARLRVIASAVEQVVSEFPRWRHSRVTLAAVIVTAMLKESSLWESVHDGSLRGGAGEICLMQIHPKNGRWKKWSPTFDALAGVDYDSTLRCVRTGVDSLVSSDAYCRARHYERNWSIAMWTMYHYGNRCWISPEAKPRTALMIRLESALRWQLKHSVK